MDVEALMTAGYGVLMLAAALILEWLSARTHERALAYRTSGFEFDTYHDRWTCPEGEHLWPHEYDHERRFVRYQAKAHICNGCPRKIVCTDSDEGREITRPVDPWPHSEAGRFHRAIAVMLTVVSILILLVGLARSGGDPVVIVLFVTLLAVAVSICVVLARDLVRHPVAFPEGAGIGSSRVAHVGSDGVRPPTRWGSQRRGMTAGTDVE